MSEKTVIVTTPASMPLKEVYDRAAAQKSLTPPGYTDSLRTAVEQPDPNREESKQV